MWIKKLYATFGKLDNRTLSLGEGLNVVYGQNESGKSTWSAFIRAMFYGISTREKAKAGYIPDKEKFRPWNGSAMYGKMELSKSGEDITIERTASPRTGVFAKENAVYDKNGAVCETGAALVGAESAVYERTAFIGQARLALDGNAETEKRILSIASSGDESVSARDVRDRLLKRQREIRSVRGIGSLPKLEEERFSLQKCLDDAEATEAEILHAEGVVKAAAEDEKRFCRALKIAEAEERTKKRSYIAEAKAELERRREVSKEFEKYPTRERYDEFAAKKDEWRTLTIEHERRVNERAQALRESETAKQRLADFPAFSGMNEELARETAEADISRLGESGKKNISAAAVVVLALAAVFVVLGIAWNAVMFALAAVFAVTGVCSFISSCGKEKLRVEQEILRKYGVEERSGIAAALAAYVDAVEKQRKCDEYVSSLTVAAETAKSAAELRRNDVIAFLQSYGIQCADDINRGEKMLREMIEAHDSAKRELDAARIRVEAIEQSVDDGIEELEYSRDEIPSESVGELEIRASETAERRKRYELALAALRERISGFDRAQSEARLEVLSSEIEEQELMFDAYSLAMKNIEEAEAELKSRFSPEVEKRASEIFAQLTGGHFEIVRIRNSDFEMDVAEGVAREPRDSLMLSQGTLDELYFSLRLALCELILGGDEAPPVILDDVFVNFDDERMQKALQLLKKLAEKRQVIVFSCHTREAEYFRDDAAVHKVNLQS